MGHNYYRWDAENQRKCKNPKNKHWDWKRHISLREQRWLTAGFKRNERPKANNRTIVIVLKKITADIELNPNISEDINYT